MLSFHPIFKYFFERSQSFRWEHKAAPLLARRIYHVSFDVSASVQILYSINEPEAGRRQASL